MDNSRRIYKSNRRVRVGDCNSKGKLRLDPIACYLQDVGFDDTNDLGLGDGGIWVARAIEITNKTESEELWPSRNDDVQIETYCGGAGRVSAQRNVNIFLKNKLAIETKTVWVSLDGNFKPCSIPKWLNEKYPNTQKISSKRTLSFSPTEDEKTNGNSFVFKVRSSDIDINNHANNAFAFDVLNEASILCGVETFSRANVEYHKPIGFKDELKVYVSKSDTEFKAWVYTQDNIACSMLWVN